MYGEPGVHIERSKDGEEEMVGEEVN